MSTNGQNFPIPENLYDSGGNRVTYVERFNQIPGINADVGIAKNVDFELLGTGAVSADLTFYAEGGVNLATHGGATDSAILLPHLDSLQSIWTGVTWGSDQQTMWGCHVRTPSSLTNITLWAGLKLTNTPVIATDADQAFFRYANGTDTNWQCITSNNNTDTQADSGIALAASTEYRLWVVIDASRVPHYFINGVEVSGTAATALKDTTDYIPYIGILSASSATAKTLVVRNVWISRKVA